MQIERLIQMANQIGAFFEAMPDQNQAAADVASHIERFWDPRMRTALTDYVAADGDAGLKPVVRAAIRRIGNRR